MDRGGGWSDGGLLDVQGSEVGGRLIACTLDRRGCGLGRLCRGR